MNYKLLNAQSVSKTSESDQLVFIFNKLYGGDTSSEISDTVAIIAEAGIMQVISNYQSTDFYEKRAEIESNIFQYLKTSFTDYFLTCSSVYMLNLEFDTRYQNSILKVMAESQKIAEKTNLLNGTQIQAATEVALANITQQMALTQAQTDGEVYGLNKQSQANAIIAYNAQIQQSVAKVGTFTANTDTKSIYNFYYILVILNINISL